MYCHLASLLSIKLCSLDHLFNIFTPSLSDYLYYSCYYNTMKELASVINVYYKEDDLKQIFKLLAGKKPYIYKYHLFMFLIDVLASTCDQKDGGKLIWDGLHHFAMDMSGKLTLTLLYQYYELKYDLITFLFPEVIKIDVMNHALFANAVQNSLNASIIQSSMHKEVFSLLSIESETSSAFFILSNSMIYDYPSLLYEVLRDLVTNNVFQLSNFVANQPVYTNYQLNRFRKDLGVYDMTIAEMKAFFDDHVDCLPSPFMTFDELVKVG